MQDHPRVEFVGGPFDGFVYTMSFPDEELLDTVALPVNTNIVRMLQGSLSDNKERASSVAIYDLMTNAYGTRYRFIGASAPRQHALETWVG